MKAYWEWMYSSTHSLTSALGGEWSASRPSRFTPRERIPGTNWIGGWVDPRAVLDAVVKWKILSSRRESNPRTLIVQLVAHRYTDRAITAVKRLEKTTKNLSEESRFPSRDSIQVCTKYKSRASLLGRLVPQFRIRGIPGSILGSDTTYPD
jgi:hypothetical protein